MNLDQHTRSILLDKFYGRAYGSGKILKENLANQRMSSIAVPSLCESVALSGVISWFTEVKRQIDVMITEVYAGDEAVIDMLNNIQSAFSNKHPHDEITEDDLKHDLEHVHFVLGQYANKVSGSLKQYIDQLADTVKTISLDDVATEEEAPQAEGGDFEAGSPSVGGDLGGDSLEEPAESPEGDESPELDLDFEAELEKL